MRFDSVRDIVGSVFSNMSTGFVAQDDFHFVKVNLSCTAMFLSPKNSSMELAVI